MPPPPMANLPAMAADKEFASHYWKQGYRMLAYGLDHLLLMSALSDGLAHIRQLAEEE